MGDLDVGAWIKGTFNVLTLKRPELTSGGAAIGAVLDGLMNGFAQPLKLRGFDVSQVHDWQVVMFGVVLLHLPRAAKATFRPTPFSEEIEQALAIVEQAKRSGLSDWATKQMYQDICNKVLASVQLNDAARTELESLRKAIGSVGPPPPSLM